MSDEAPRILPGETKVVAVDSLREHPENYRHGDVGAISESLGVHGQYKPVLVQKSTNRVIAGNHTLKSARATGMTEIEARIIDVDDEEALRILIVDNRASDLATNDDLALATLLTGLASDTAAGLGGTAWDGDDLDRLLQDLTEAADVTLGEPVDGPKPKHGEFPARCPRCAYPDDDIREASQ